MVALPIGHPPAPASPSPPRRRLTARFSSGHVVMIVAGLVGMVLALAALRDDPGGVEVAVAAHEIRAGEVVHAADFRTERVEAPGRVIDSFVRIRDVRRVHGRIAVATITAGDPVFRRELRPRAARSGLRAMSIPIDPSRAVGGHLAAGDRVDVLFTGDREVSIIVRDASVLAVDAKGRGGIGETTSPFTVTVAVDAHQSQLLAAAIADGDISIARTTGARSSAGTRPQPLERAGAAGATAR